MNIGVVLMNLGGPTSEDNIKTFLYNLFRDEDIIKLGGGFFQDKLARLISSVRSKKIVDNYREINYCTKGCTGSKYCFNRQEKVISTCCSPINGLTELQRRTLEKQFKRDYPQHNFKVYTCMRYWLPFADQIMDEIREDGMDHVVLLPLYPQFSWTTSGSSFRDWENVRAAHKASGKTADWSEYIIKDYYLNPDYIGSLNDRINETLERFSPEERNQVHLVFTAHGTPIAEVESGDPYTKQINDTVEAIMNHRGRDKQYWLGFQSRVGPQKWTQPNTEDLVFRLIRYGVKHLIMVPVAFVTDHIETAMELNIELREAIEEEKLHIEKLEVMPGLNDHPGFIKALANETYQCLSHLLKEEPSSAMESIKEKQSIAS